MRISKNISIFALLLCLIFINVGCKSNTENDKVEEEDMASYQQISQEKAKEMIDSQQELTILDVRTLEEYEEGRISGAQLLPNEEISEETAIEMFPDKEEVLLIYCRSGNRSKQAAEKLVGYGYTNVYEFGGIITWPYEIEK
ncbi:MAG: rhodanese-like domain-containing protein [Clostridiales bacterium]|nr:rhodanese-like domain-containing protein [Clostridiales bacterium]